MVPVPTISTTTLPFPDPAPASTPSVITPPPASAPRLTNSASGEHLAPTSTGDRDSLLDRLRARARALDPSDVQRILSTRRRA
jgi:hypothetical protein